MKKSLSCLMLMTCATLLRGEPPAPSPERELAAAIADLAALRQSIADEKLPIAREIHRTEDDLLTARRAHDAVKRRLDRRTLDLTAIQNEIKAREQENLYLANLLAEYIRGFETRIHIAELSRHMPAIEAARQSAESPETPPAEAIKSQFACVTASLDRLDDLAGGTRFAGRGAGEDGIVKKGDVLLLGPLAAFVSHDNSLVGLAEQRLGSIEPAVLPVDDPDMMAQIVRLVREGEGLLPIDGSLGNARKMAETRETLEDRVRKGGPVMYPILTLAALAALVALGKWLHLTLVRLPTSRRLLPLYDAVRAGDTSAAASLAQAIRGPAGRMLRTGLEQIARGREVAEEAMFEKMLNTRFSLNRFLPFLAVTAACAPLLGLLGTVTGIISTFQLMTVFGTGDIRMLSSGISEALITTEFGLYVAIPAVLLHAFLNRKARGMIDRMEQIAILFLTAVGTGTRAPEEAGGGA